MGKNDKATLDMLAEARKMQEVVRGKTMSDKEVQEVMRRWSVKLMKKI